MPASCSGIGGVAGEVSFDALEGVAQLPQLVAEALGFVLGGVGVLGETRPFVDQLSAAGLEIVHHRDRLLAGVGG